MTARVHPGTLVGGLIGWSSALAPGQLPRPALLLAMVGTALCLVGMGVGAAAGALVARGRTASSRFVAAVGVIAAALLVAALWWQDVVSGSVGGAAPGLGWAMTVAAVPLLTAGAVVVVPARVWAAGAALVAVVAGPAAVANAANRVPDDPRLSYSTLADDPFADRAEELVDAWVAAGGADEDAVVVAVPTGSGWVDDAALDGFVTAFDGSVRFVAMQYSRVPSWQAYLRSPDAAGDSATAVVRALDERIAPLPHRPRIYLFGQSLGAVGADAARAWAGDADVHIAGTVLSGTPAGSVPALPRCARRVSIANATDPVADFQTSLLWRPADRATVTGTVGVPAARAPWTPIGSFIGTALDLLVSLDGPTGTGHHYGPEQGRAVTRMPVGCQSTGPRAAS